MKLLKISSLILTTIILSSCSTRSVKPLIAIPNEPGYKDFAVEICVSREDKKLCMSQDSYANLLENLTDKEAYKESLLALLCAIAEVENPHMCPKNGLEGSKRESN